MTAPAPFMIGSSAATRELDREIEIAAQSHAKVLITGETGVGKDLVARLIHQRSSRRNAAMSVINCAGIPDTLLESELFGHKRGSFTGAYRDKAGLLEVANGGTAFLDEAGEMSMRMQAMLLRFLETGELQRVGSDATLKRVNVRVIAATNRDLRERIEAGEFREDLYYRLNVILIRVQPLRQRPEDVLELLHSFIDSFSRQYGVPRRTVTPEAMRLLTEYRWPGNVRELKNVVERLVVRAPGMAVQVSHLPDEIRCPGVVKSAPDVADPAVSVAGELLLRMTEHGESFWSAVHAPFIGRDLAREQLRAVVKTGLERSAGNYKAVLRMFNLPPDDYKRFLSFLRKHGCHFPVHAFRAAAGRPVSMTTP